MLGFRIVGAVTIAAVQMPGSDCAAVAVAALVPADAPSKGGGSRPHG